MDVGVDGWWPDQGDGFDGPSRARIGIACTGKARSSIARTSGRSRCIATRRPACSASADSSGRATCSRAGRRSRRTCPSRSTRVSRAFRTGAPTSAGSFRRPNTRASCTCAGSSSARSVPLFRSHGRNWHLHLPWGWDGGDGGPPETQNFKRRSGRAAQRAGRADLPEVSRAALPADAVPLHGRARDARHGHADHARALAASSRTIRRRSRAATSISGAATCSSRRSSRRARRRRRVYLPRGTWFDFWTEERVEGGREIERAVDLATMPLYVRAGAVIPMGPVKQYTDEPIDRTDDARRLSRRRRRVHVVRGRRQLVRLSPRRRDAVIMTWRDASRRLSLRLVARLQAALGVTASDQHSTRWLIGHKNHRVHRPPARRASLSARARGSRLRTPALRAL